MNEQRLNMAIAFGKGDIIGSTWDGSKNLSDELGFEKDRNPSPQVPTIGVNCELHLDQG